MMQDRPCDAFLTYLGPDSGRLSSTVGKGVWTRPGSYETLILPASDMSIARLMAINDLRGRATSRISSLYSGASIRFTNDDQYAVP